MMRNTIRLFLLVETLSFLIAGLIHSGLLVAVEIHPQAAIAESTIGAVLLFALIFALAWPAQTRLIGVVAQLLRQHQRQNPLRTVHLSNPRIPHPRSTWVILPRRYSHSNLNQHLRTSPNRSNLPWAWAWVWAWRTQ